MKNKTIPILIASFVAMLFLSEVRAEPVTISEARTVATNWINLVIHKRGDWGG